MKKILLFLMITLLPISMIFSQQIDIDNNRKAQIAFIKTDTLPIDILSLSEIINTPYSEYNGTLTADSVFYFSSLRPESSEDFGNIFEEFWSTRIYQSSLTISGFSRPIVLPRAINDEQYYNCNFTLSKDKSSMFFSRCLRSSTKNLECTIWKSKNKNGKWEKAQPLNRRINLPGTTTTQPHLVEYEDYSVLYFVSNRPNGYGELDIWYSILRNNHFDDPVNLGNSVNTPDSEISPFYDTTKKRLYFSSDGTHLTIGGFDIFYTTGALSQWTPTTNIGVPINSTANDFYFTVNPCNSDGYFSSNRPKSPEQDADTCCSDIYCYHWLYSEKNDSIQKDSSVIAIDTLTNQEKITLLLPVTLYFHNDQPNPRTTQTTTNENYAHTLSNYLSLKEIYIKEYTKGLKNEEKEAAEQTILRFFEDSVASGFHKLETMVNYLWKDLQEGNNVTITICGFASPLHKSDYNLALSSRRIESFVNYLREYNNGIFLPFLNGKANNQLVIIKEAEGSSQAKSYVSNNPNDQRNSIYSIAASLERRIQVTKYEVTK